jgi:flagellar protein FlaJ
VLLATAGALFAGIGLLGIPTTRWLDFLTFALLVFIGPYGFYAAARRGRVKRLEERFPDFLRDLAANRKAGLTLPAAVKIASKGEYGALTPEIVRMADQLSWNVAFDEALERFGERAKTPLIQRAVALILEASRTGGNVTDVLLAAARDAREIKNLETERATSMLLYTAIIYIAFLVFLGIAGTLYGTFVPQIAAATAGVGGGSSSQVAGLSVGKISVDEYRTFYFVATLVQAVGNGVVAGVMESGRAVMGLRHSFIMVLFTYVTFAFILT